MVPLESVVAVVMGGIIALVTAGAVVAKRLNGRSCPIPEHVELLAKHDAMIKTIQEDLTAIKETLCEVRDAVLVLKGGMK